jgi:anti-anti-sigma factor
MEISCDQYDEVDVISIDGELSVDTLEVFKNIIQERLEQGRVHFVVNCEKVSHIDSQGLEILLWLKDQCLECEGQMNLAALDEVFAKILALTRLDRRFDVYDKVLQAVSRQRSTVATSP